MSVYSPRSVGDPRDGARSTDGDEGSTRVSPGDGTRKTTTRTTTGEGPSVVTRCLSVSWSLRGIDRRTHPGRGPRLPADLCHGNPADSHDPEEGVQRTGREGEGVQGTEGKEDTGDGEGVQGTDGMERAPGSYRGGSRGKRDVGHQPGRTSPFRTRRRDAGSPSPAPSSRT